MKKILVLLVLSAMVLVLSSSNTSNRKYDSRTVTGVVKDYLNDIVLPGAEVVVKGTSYGTTTDVDGKYSLSVPDYSVTLVFGYINCDVQEINTENKTVINVELLCDY